MKKVLLFVVACFSLTALAAETVGVGGSSVGTFTGVCEKKKREVVVTPAIPKVEKTATTPEKPEVPAVKETKYSLELHITASTTGEKAIYLNDFDYKKPLIQEWVSREGRYKRNFNLNRTEDFSIELKGPYERPGIYLNAFHYKEGKYGKWQYFACSE